MNNIQNNLMSAGFAGLPFGGVNDCSPMSIAVLGVPTEPISVTRRGSSRAPDILRDQSQKMSISIPTDGVDLGNLILTSDWNSHLETLILKMHKKRVIPVIFGGASDVASTTFKSIPDLPVVAIAPTLRSDLLNRTDNTIFLGLNGDQPAEYWDQMMQRSMLWRSAKQLDSGDKYLSDLPRNAVLWIDISVIDLGHAAGSLGLNPGGIKPESLISSLSDLKCIWEAIVVTGLAPAYDTRGLSELTVIETLSEVFRNE